MDALLAALADPARWRLVSLLAERPRPVGVLARLAEARQPQTTKHLQALERAGVVTSQRTGQRRIYALQPAPLRDLAAALSRLADAADQADGPRETYDRYGLGLHAERLAAREPGWADGRSFGFLRSLTGSPELVWRHLTETPCSPAGGRPTTCASPSSSSRRDRAGGSSRSTATPRTPTAPTRSPGARRSRRRRTSR
ncbi:ArsR/SmtB family transcription factor [Streptosporangium lutulentum]